jgi:diacylglycerol O-acyltransferase / wax synthase
MWEQHMGRRMSPADAVWYQGETQRNRMTVSSVVWLDGPIDIPQLCERLEERVLDRHPAFRERVVPSRIPGRLPRWEETDVDLDAHLRVVDLPAPGHHALLEARCSLERSTPFDRDRPLWTMTIYRGYRGDGTAIHTRLHHCLGDGIALMQLFVSLGDEHAEEPPNDERPTPLAVRLLGLGHQAAARVAEHARHPSTLVTAGQRAVVTAGWTARLFLPSVVERNVLHGTPQGTKLMAWDPDGYPLERVKAAGRRAGATVNEVLLTIAAGALHRYLAERDALVDEVLVMVHVSLRDPSLPLSRYLDNRIGLLPIRLPVRSSDPHERLAGVRAQSQELKGSPAPVVAHGLLLGTALTPPRIERGLHRFNQWRSTGVITNVPGPSEPLHLTGARVLGSIGWGGLTAELNLTGAFVSFGGRVFAGFVTDTAVTADPERLLVHVQAEWADVLAALSDGDVSVTR